MQVASIQNFCVMSIYAGTKKMIMQYDGTVPIACVLTFMLSRERHDATS